MLHATSAHFSAANESAWNAMNIIKPDFSITATAGEYPVHTGMSNDDHSNEIYRHRIGNLGTCLLY